MHPRRFLPEREQVIAALIVGLVVIVVSFASGLGIEYRTPSTQLITAPTPNVPESRPVDSTGAQQPPVSRTPVHYIGAAAPTMPPATPSVKGSTSGSGVVRVQVASGLSSRPSRTVEATASTTPSTPTPPATPTCPPTTTGLARVLELPPLATTQLVDVLLSALRPLVSIPLVWSAVPTTADTAVTAASSSSPGSAPCVTATP